MPLSIFIDALPYNEIMANYQQSFENMQVSEMIPNIAYSSSLHWQLYCNKYPDERGVLVDWVKTPEKNKAIRFISTVLTPLDYLGDIGVVAKKVLDRFVFRKNAFANIPFKFRKDFSEMGKYLFWDEKTYRKESIFDGYDVVSQDEGHLTFEITLEKLKKSVQSKKENIFAVFGFADALGHKCERGEKYSMRLLPYMKELFDVIKQYKTLNPNEPVLIVSDHGMSTVKKYVDLGLEQKFGRQSKKTYIAYCDTAVMCIFTKDEKLKKEIENYLSTRDEGHLLTVNDRQKYKATDKKFGDIIYILKEGTIFSQNWFGKSLKKPSADGFGMHGFWPEWSSYDQNACVILINSDTKLKDKYDYPDAHLLINNIMKGNCK